MPRILHSPLALTTRGELLLNLTQLDVPRSPEALLRVALDQPATLFVGLLLSSRERERLLYDVEMIVPNVTLPVVARRNHPPYGAPHGQIKKTR